jgi:hypothetical protein
MLRFCGIKASMEFQSDYITGPFLVDAHVHVHSCYPADRLLDAAKANFASSAVSQRAPERALGCLLFTESSSADFFAALCDGSSRAEVGGWRLERTDEETSLLACLDDRPTLLLVAGRQIATCEGLEVLALMSRQRFSDRLTLDETIEAVRAAGAIAVIPWGFGKWWFARGRLLEQYLNSPHGGSVLLGDNGGRPALFPRPPLFAIASRGSLPVLPGSDPLPFPSEMSRIGTYGFMLEGSLDCRTPAASLKRLIEDLDHQPPVFGRSASLLKFVVNQSKLRLQ